MYGLFPFMSINCPSCGRPMAQKGEEIDPAGDSGFVEVVGEFLKVDKKESVHNKVEALQKVYRFVRREDPPQSDRED